MRAFDCRHVTIVCLHSEMRQLLEGIRSDYSDEQCESDHSQLKLEYHQGWTNICRPRHWWGGGGEGCAKAGGGGGGGTQCTRRLTSQTEACEDDRKAM